MGSEDEEDFRQALEAQERFRNRHNRSTSTVTPRTSYTASKRDPSQSRQGSALNSPELQRDVPAPIKLSATPKEHAGDLKAMKDERQRRKDQAARDLEERRKSLALRPLAPTIPHPSHLSPGLPQMVEAPAALQTESGPRTHSGELRSMYARNNAHVGLPATPKAMRLVLDSDSANLPDVPPIPATFAQRNSPTSSPSYRAVEREPEKPKDELPSLTLLPSTVYQPPSRPMIPRSMSAPPEKQAMPRRGSDASRQPPMPTLQARAHSRAGSIAKAGAGDLQGIREASDMGRQSSHSNQIPPPPPPPPAPPVMLKELQHLALPPPPPPAPLPHLAHSKAGGLASGMIEIVVDDDEKAAPAAAETLSSQTYSQSHSRGRSFNDRAEKDSSISGRLNKAADRFRGRSASRTRAPRESSRMRSPPSDGYSPYESIQPPNYQPMRIAPYESVRDPNPKGMSTGLHESELI